MLAIAMAAMALALMLTASTAIATMLMQPIEREENIPNYLAIEQRAENNQFSLVKNAISETTNFSRKKDSLNMKPATCVTESTKGIRYKQNGDKIQAKPKCFSLNATLDSQNLSVPVVSFLHKLAQYMHMHEVRRFVYFIQLKR